MEKGIRSLMKVKITFCLLMSKVVRYMMLFFRGHMCAEEYQIRDE